MSRGKTLTCISLAVLLSLRLQEAHSHCPNSCSGHGSCDRADNTCTCYEGWDYVADCSQRTCEKGVARFEGATAANVAHGSTGPLAECSNAGFCDRTTGVCDCIVPYTGKVCERQNCPSSDGRVCSGPGGGMSMSHLGKHWGVDTTPGVAGDGVGPCTNWEADINYGCFCDGAGRL